MHNTIELMTSFGHVALYLCEKDCDASMIKLLMESLGPIYVRTEDADPIWQTPHGTEMSEAGFDSEPFWHIIPIEHSTNQGLTFYQTSLTKLHQSYSNTHDTC